MDKDMIYKILIKHNSDKKNNLWQSYGSSVTTTSTSSTTTTFTEFSTEDIEVLRAEIIKLDAEVGHNNIRVVSDIELTYGVEIVSDETDTEDNTSTESTTPDDTTSGDDNSEGNTTTDDGEDETVTP